MKMLKNEYWEFDYRFDLPNIEYFEYSRFGLPITGIEYLRLGNWRFCLPNVEHARFGLLNTQNLEIEDLVRKVLNISDLAYQILKILKFKFALQKFNI